MEIREKRIRSELQMLKKLIETSQVTLAENQLSCLDPIFCIKIDSTEFYVVLPVRYPFRSPQVTLRSPPEDLCPLLTLDDGRDLLPNICPDWQVSFTLSSLVTYCHEFLQKITSSHVLIDLGRFWFQPYNRESIIGDRFKVRLLDQMKEIVVTHGALVVLEG